MDLTEKTKAELREIAKKRDIKLPPGDLSIERLQGVIEDALLVQQVRREEEVREKLRADAKLKQNIADIQAEAELAKIKIVIPQNPTLVDVARLKKELGMKVSEPKPSPETLAIRKSKKVYATFKNLEEKGVDVVTAPGGEFRMRCWPGRRHVIPEWLIGYHDRQALTPQYKQIKDPRTGNTVSRLVDNDPRFIWQAHGDAPADAPFGVCVETKEAVAV